MPRTGRVHSVIHMVFPCLDLVPYESQSPLVSLPQRLCTPATTTPLPSWVDQMPCRAPSTHIYGVIPGPHGRAPYQAESLANELLPPASKVFLSQDHMRLGQQNGAHMILSDSECFASPAKKKKKKKR